MKRMKSAVILFALFTVLHATLALATESPLSVRSWIQLSTNAIASASRTNNEKKLALDAFEALLREWKVSQWPSSTDVIASFDLSYVLHRILPVATPINSIDDRRRIGVRFQWPASNGAEITAESCTYEDAGSAQYRLLSEMRMFGRPKVSVSEFKDAVLIQTERSLALAYNNAYIRLSYYRRYHDRGHAEDPITVIKPIIQAIYEELQKTPTGPVKKERVVEVQLPYMKTLTVGEASEITFKATETFRGYRLGLENMNEVQKRGVTAKKINEDGVIKVMITPVQAGQIEFAFVLGSTNGNVRSAVIILDVVEPGASGIDYK